ncbi:MAG: hypothetical protein J6P31_04780 [Oscillospiraceae bacterium]|nr:hypothetical protein [Oscillospiraceae bacterium]
MKALRNLRYNQPMEKKRELYSPADTARLHRKIRCFGAALGLLVCAALVVCVLFCVRTTTLSAARMERNAVVTSTLAGWLLIAVYSEIITPARREAAHVEHVLTGPGEWTDCTLTVSPESFRIRRSIRVRSVLLHTADGSRSVLVHAPRAALLPADGTPVRVCTVHGYITAWEESS